MSTGLDVFDHTLQETNGWLKDLMQLLGTEDRKAAYRILRATLHALRDRIGEGNALHLGAQLPILLRGVYYEGWRGAASQSKERRTAAFLEHVQAESGHALHGDVEADVRAVFTLLWERIDAGEIAKLIQLFPAEMRDLWPRLARED
ncbi:MAG: DUF2267 domain-containing protein [Alphaproteobacteria bacterium]|nr:DUF2267 domain-containing protein [Alphaproteobacteria bacterium]